ncbi:MAG: alcohol dehydrogenase, partial [Halobacteria archaeon]|nr:alcohol dehydrogenase [Halobacteria archaeon]
GEIVTKTVDLGQVPDELEAMSDFETMGFPVINEF